MEKPINYYSAQVHHNLLYYNLYLCLNNGFDLYKWLHWSVITTVIVAYNLKVDDVKVAEGDTHRFCWLNGTIYTTLVDHATNLSIL